MKRILNGFAWGVGIVSGIVGIIVGVFGLLDVGGQEVPWEELLALPSAIVTAVDNIERTSSNLNDLDMQLVEEALRKYIETTE